MKDILKQVIARHSLTQEQAESVMTGILNEQYKPEQIGAFMIALQMKGEHRDEITGFARTLRAHMQSIPVKKAAMDTCGTGGDGANTFNISTAVSFVLASLGVPVVKHGNRAVSGKCGSADVLEVLGLPTLTTVESVMASLEHFDYAFCFAPAFHPALKTVAELRKNLGVRTAFNLLGPLCNPAKTSHQIMGVFDITLTDTMAEVLGELGSEEAMVVASVDGLDEISLAGPTKVSHLKEGQVRTYHITPEDAGLETQSLKGIEGGNAEENARIILDIFEGTTGPARDIVLLNSAAALQIFGKVESLKEGAEMAAKALDEGQVKAHFERLKAHYV